MQTEPVLSSEEIENVLADHEGWSVKDGKLYKQYRFKSFTQAFAFMTQAAILSEKLNHHPEWSNVYNRVDINLVSHDAGGITVKDTNMLGKLEKIYQTYVI